MLTMTGKSPVVCATSLWGGHYTGESESVEIRATTHCHGCGKIVCSRCSEHKMSLPRIGILHPVRVCDFCRFKVEADSKSLAEPSSKRASIIPDSFVLK